MKHRFVKFIAMNMVLCLMCGTATAAYASPGVPTGSNGWVQFDGNWYWFSNGSMIGGWVKTGGAWYYMDPSDGHMLTGWQTIAGDTYYLNPDGDMLTGWLQAGSNWYWFDDSGAMATNCWVQTGGKWYWFNADGTMATGWQIIDGAWYFLNPGGYNGLPDGAMATGWLKLGNDWYWLTSSGAMGTGWVKTGGYWYYMDPADGHMLTGLQSINGATYYLYGDGSMATGWVNLGGYWYWFNGDGAMTTGWVKTGGYWYYMDPSDGHMLSNQWVVDYENRVQYYLMSDGRMATKESELPTVEPLTDADLRRAEAELDAWAVAYYASLRPDAPALVISSEIENMVHGFGRCNIYNASDRSYSELVESGKHAFGAILEENPQFFEEGSPFYLTMGKTTISIQNNTIYVNFLYRY